MPWKTNCYKEQRWKLVQEFLRNKNGLAELCRRWAISRKTAYKWFGRFKERGRFGLADRRRAAHRVGNRPTECWLKRIRRWRAKHPTWGAPKLHWALERRFGNSGLPSEAAISRWLKQWGLTRRPRRTAHKGPVMERPKLTLARDPNDVWTVDFKGWFRTGDGVRVEPLTIRDLASRYVLGIFLFRQQNVRDCRRAFERIFDEQGLPLVIRADNGTPFGATGALGLTRLSAWWVKLGIKMEFIAPGHPEQNGAHDSCIGCIRRKPPNLSPPASERSRSAASAGANTTITNGRMKRWACVCRLRSIAKVVVACVPPLKHWRYELGWESRLVKGKGMISFNGRSRFIGEAFEGERVGLKRSRVGVWQVCFGPLQIGELWDRDATPGIRAA